MILFVKMFSEPLICEVVFLTVKIFCCSYSNLLLTKMYFFIEARTLNADQMRFDSRFFE